jgi:putative transcriptional regulator
VVRAKRKSLGLSQEKLAEKAGCDRQSINRVENAAYSPSLDRVFKLADALGMSLSDLFDEFDRVDQNTPQQNGSAGSAARDVPRQGHSLGDRAATN